MADFYFASALAGSSERTARFRERARIWMGVNISLALIVILLSSILRMSHATTRSETVTNPVPVEMADP
jgi:hypothetical protein